MTIKPVDMESGAITSRGQKVGWEEVCTGKKRCHASEMWLVAVNWDES